MIKEFDKDEYNKLCLKFMDLKYKNSNKAWVLWPEISENWISTSNLKFHSDWNWIMKVCGKIYKILDPSDSRKHDIKAKVGALQKDAVVLAIWEFLNWYNENKNK
jgi:hypothetical protein